MAKYSNTDYIDAEISVVLSKAQQILNDRKQWWAKWTILETTESSISAREGLLGFLISGPITMTIRVSTVQPGGPHRVGSTRVHCDLSCWGIGPINNYRLKRTEDKIIGQIMLSVLGDDRSL